MSCDVVCGYVASGKLSGENVVHEVRGATKSGLTKGVELGLHSTCGEQEFPFEGELSGQSLPRAFIIASLQRVQLDPQHFLAPLPDDTLYIARDQPHPRCCSRWHIKRPRMFIHLSKQFYQWSFLPSRV